MYGPRAPLGICREFFVSRGEAVHALIILDANTQANSDELFTRLDWLPLQLEVKVNICVQVHKRINGRSPGYMSDLLDPVYMEWGTPV